MHCFHQSHHLPLQSGCVVLNYRNKQGCLHKASHSHLDKMLSGLWAYYLSLKRGSNSIHNAAKAYPLFSATESCCASRCVGRSKLLNCICKGCQQHCKENKKKNRISQDNSDYQGKEVVRRQTEMLSASKLVASYWQLGALILSPHIEPRSKSDS